MRWPTPTCGAARPMPGAAYMVSAMSSTSAATVPSMSVTAVGGVLEDGVGVGVYLADRHAGEAYVAA